MSPPAPAHPPAPPGFVVWMEGLSGSGKSTLSKLLRERLAARGWKVQILDGDEVRQGLSPELGFSRKDRETHAHRVSYVARLLSQHGVVVLVALITPYESSRKAARALIQENFVEVYVRAPIAVCQERDPKGLYRKTKAGDVKQMTGVDDPFEEPSAAELVVDTTTSSVEVSAEQILAHLTKRGLLPRAEA